MAWLRLTNVSPATVLNSYLGQCAVGQYVASYPDNIRLDNYYSKGTVVRKNDSAASPLIVYADEDMQGVSETIAIDQVFAGSKLPMDNAIASFSIAKGYMATMAVNEDGTGLSQVYIASEEDLIINQLPAAMQSAISFIRVVPWNWVDKKGTGGDIADMGNSWFYQWGNIGSSDLPREYAPMAWGKGGANDDTDIELYKSKYKATHVMAFNESDNCHDQSGQWGNLCDTDVAVATYQNLMKTGLRLVSPSCRENAPFGWLKEFYEKATAQGIRIDVIGVHWYDWGNNPKNSPNADPLLVFNRFKSYLQRVYDLYQLPIWITEFNANPNRSTAVNQRFMELALPYLETLDYVERYAWFQPNSGVADYLDKSGDLTFVGTFYINQASTPAVTASSKACDSNLNDAIATSVSQLPYADKDELKIYPNPTAAELYIEYSGAIEQVEIFNQVGQLVFRISGEHVLNVSDLPKGNYIIKVNHLCEHFVKL